MFPIVTGPATARLPAALLHQESRCPLAACGNLVRRFSHVGGMCIWTCFAGTSGAGAVRGTESSIRGSIEWITSSIGRSFLSEIVGNTGDGVDLDLRDSGWRGCSHVTPVSSCSAGCRSPYP